MSYSELHNSSMRKLFLDDAREPSVIYGIGSSTWDVVRSYDELVQYIQTRGCPHIISFDHDLAFEHYPFAEENPGKEIPYDKYKEKTGLHCARWLIENGYTDFKWMVHSFNPDGARNIREYLRQFNPKGEMRR